MQTYEFLRADRHGTGDAVYVPMIQPPNFHWHLTADVSTPDPVHLRPAGTSWSGITSTGRLVVNDLRIDLIDPAHQFIRMISEILPSSDEADEIGDRLIRGAVGTSKIRPIKKRLSD